MTDPDLNDDDVLLALLHDALDDDVPDDAVRAAIDAFGLRQLDAELAELVTDSLVDGGVTMRAAEGAPRLVTFRADDLSIDLELSESLVVGVLTPPAPWTVIVETTRGMVRTAADDLGRFRSAIEAGRVRLHLLGGERGVVTPWITR